MQLAALLAGSARDLLLNSDLLHSGIVQSNPTHFICIAHFKINKVTAQQIQNSKIKEVKV